MPRKKKSTDPVPAVEVGKKENPETETKKEKLPLYGKLTSGEMPKKEKKASEPKKESKPAFFNFGKITSESVKEPENKKPEKAKKKGESKPAKKGKPNKDDRRPKKKDAVTEFNRDAVFAVVFGYELEKKAEAKSGAEIRTEKKLEKPEREKKAEKTPAPKKKVRKEIRTLSKKARDEIFAEVFGYIIDAPVEEEEKKQAGTSKQLQKEKKRKSGVFNLFRNAGKKNRPDIRRKKKEEEKKLPGETETPKEEAVEIEFDRDAVFASVFGYDYKNVKKKNPVPEVEVTADPESKIEPEELKEKKQPNTMDSELKRLIADSYTGDYPKLTLRKPFTDSEKRWANEFEQFYKSRGYNVAFKVGGATKTGVISEKLFRSGKPEDVLRFIQAGKTIAYTLFENGEDGYQKELLSARSPRYTFDKRFEPILNTAQSFGLISSYYEHTDRNSGAARVTAYFSKYRKVLDFFRGEFLESYAYYIANKVAGRIASERKLPFEIAANLVTTSSNGASVHEYDTVIRIGSQIFLIEEKSSPYFCDFNKFAQDMDRLQFSKKNYMILLVNKTGEEAEAVEWLFDFRVANVDTYVSKLRQMLEEGLDDSIPNV